MEANNGPGKTRKWPGAKSELLSRYFGRVYVCLEVAGNRKVKHPRILGTTDLALEAEGLHLIKKLPVATTPPQLPGRPVRVFYGLNFTSVSTYAFSPEPSPSGAKYR